MLTVFSPENFRTIPWKNGLGHTTELAISEGGSLDDFDWRLSIASVVNDGDFFKLCRVSTQSSTH